MNGVWSIEPCFKMYISDLVINKNVLSSMGLNKGTKVYSSLFKELAIMTLVLLSFL